MASTATDNEFAQAWQANRPYLVNLAYGMLGDIGAAEDAVQEAFARFSTADRAAIKDTRGWLIVVTSRICLDQIGSARVRREHAVDASTIEFTHAAERAPDPADRVTLDDEVRSALLVVLERLSPAERVVFVLHDIFQTPFDSIATTVGRPVASCRQLARRARLKIAGNPSLHRRRWMSPNTDSSSTSSSTRCPTATLTHWFHCSTPMCGATPTWARSTHAPVS